MKVKTINRSEEAYTRERTQDVAKVRAALSAAPPAQACWRSGGQHGT